MKRALGPQHIETFRAVVMSGSMTSAANELNTSQSQVSRLIAQLEQRVGFPLFIRKGKRISTSPEGTRFFDEVEKTYVSLSKLEDAALKIRSFQSERLRVAAMPRLAAGLLTRAVACFKLTHPEAMVSIHSGTSSEVHGWIESGFCDVGLSMRHGAPHSSLKSRSIMASKCVCVLPVGHRLERLERVTARDLCDEKFITFPIGSSIRRELDSFFAGANVQPNIVAETDLGASACALVAAGVGVSIINPLAARDEAANDRIVVLPVYPSVPVTLDLVYPPHRQRTQLVDEFERFARQSIKRELESSEIWWGRTE